MRSFICEVGECCCRGGLWSLPVELPVFRLWCLNTHAPLRRVWTKALFGTPAVWMDFPDSPSGHVSLPLDPYPKPPSLQTIASPPLVHLSGRLGPAVMRLGSGSGPEQCKNSTNIVDCASTHRHQDTPADATSQPAAGIANGEVSDPVPSVHRPSREERSAPARTHHQYQTAMNRHVVLPHRAKPA